VHVATHVYVCRIVRAFLVEEQKVVKKVIKAQGAATKAA
jgi:hypothetical protein